jgi:sensor domain CHASE-containing protein
MDESKRYLANPVVSCGDEKDGSVLFNPDTDDMVVINPSGKLIWEFIQSAHTAQEIAAHLVETYQGVSAEQAAQDAQGFVDSLLGDFVLEVQAGDGH